MGTPATFSVQVSGTVSTAYRWQRRTGTASFTNISGATSSSYTLNSPTAADNNAEFRVIVTTAGGSLTSESATLTVIVGSPPTPVIVTPLVTNKYVAGDVIHFSGYATDPDELGNLPLSNLTWEVTFQHDDHDHPELAPFSGASGGSFRVPVEGETSANTWFRIHLTAVDSTGLSTSTFRDIFPIKSFFTINTNVPGIGLFLDGSPVPAPTTTEGVVGVRRSISAPLTQVVGGKSYRFVNWVHGGERVQTISTLMTNQTYTAIFEEVDGGPDPDSLSEGLITHFTLDESQGLSGGDSAVIGIPDVATLTGGATWEPDGIRDGAVRFDGVNGFLAIPDSTDTNNKAVSETTIGFWFKADNVNRPGTQVLFKQGGSPRGLNVYLNGGRLYVGGWSDKAQWAGTFLSTNMISSDQWHHVALVLDAEPTLTPDSIRGYLDGELFASGQATEIARHLGNVSFGASDESTRLHIGNSSSKVLEPFAGAIDDIRFYNRALTPAELALLGGDQTVEPTAKLSINDVTRNEGNQVTTEFLFTIAIDAPLTNDLVLRVDTADNGSAVAGTDYIALVNRLVTIPAGALSTTVAVQVIGDTVVEENETFLVQVSIPSIGHDHIDGQDHLHSDGTDHDSPVEIIKGTGVGTILNDDSEAGPDPVSTSNFVTHFTFDEGTGTVVNDTAPFGVLDTSTLVNGATFATEGIIGGSVQFDGINDFVAIPDSVDTNDRIVAKTTISLWFKADDVNRPGKQTLFKQSGDKRGLNIYIDGGSLFVGGWSDSADWSGTFLSTNAIQSGQWHHVALAIDARPVLAPDSFFAYLDGAQFGSGAGAAISKHLGNVSLGALDQSTRFHDGDSGGPTGVSPYAGLIDEFRIYHRVLSSSEVESLAESGNTPLALSRSGETITLFSLASTTDRNDPQSRMDVNGDGNVTAIDALRVINKLSKDRWLTNDEGGSASYDERFDVNDDSLITAADALAIINHLARTARRGGAVSTGLATEEDNDSATSSWDSAITDLVDPNIF